jgi:antitoxin ParD1/3/4
MIKEALPTEGTAMAGIERLTITLPEDMASRVKDAVAEGGYASTSEIVREALRDWEVKAEMRRHKLAALREHVDRGIKDIAHGDIVDADIDEIMRRGIGQSRKKRRSG